MGAVSIIPFSHGASSERLTEIAKEIKKIETYLESGSDNSELKNLLEKLKSEEKALLTAHEEKVKIKKPAPKKKVIKPAKKKRSLKAKKKKAIPAPIIVKPLPSHRIVKPEEIDSEIKATENNLKNLRDLYSSGLKSREILNSISVEQDKLKKIKT